MSVARRLIGEPAQRRPLFYALIGAGRRVGVTPYNWRLLKSTRHARLHLPARGPRRLPAYVAREPLDVQVSDLALCERLIAAYHAALGDSASADQAAGMWSWIYETRQQHLAEILDRRDGDALALELATMFRSTFVLGLAPGALVAHSTSVLGGHIWRAKAVDGLISLAEALGVVAVQDAEQGRGTARLDDGLGRICERIEPAVGHTLDMPDIGAAHGVEIEGRMLTIDLPEQVYAAVRVRQAIGLHLPAPVARAPRVVEIGGGYGSMAYWLLVGRPAPSSYTIVDLPIVGVLQGYFLSKALGASVVSLYGEPPARVVLLPNTALTDVTAPYDVLINKDSMPEMPVAAVLEYLAWARATCDGIFFSCNQESAREVHGAEQGVVPRLVEQAGGFARLRRDQSWVRAGYVEEIYAPTDARRGPRDTRP